MKHGVIEAINELIEDIDNSYSQIAEQALEHIHQNEVILTLGHSRTVMQFLCEAKKKRSFQVFIAEGAPRYRGHALAKELVAKDLQTTVITDSAVFAMISRVNMQLTKNSRSWKLKHGVIEAINELIEDIDNSYSQIAEQALEHIHQNEVILTLGHSRTVMQFLCEAKKKRSFQVFIAEGAPRYRGHALAKELVAKDLQTTVITDSAVFAMISRVNMQLTKTQGAGN